MTAMRHMGEIRSLLAQRDEEAQREAARLLLEAQGEAQWHDLLRYARGVDADVLSPDRLVQWSTVRDARGRTDQYEGALAVCGVGLYVPDMDRITRCWSTRPGWCVLDIWESDAWVTGEVGALERSAPQRCLWVVDAYHRGAAMIEDVRQARRAAEHAVFRAYDVAPAAYATGYAAVSTSNAAASWTYAGVVGAVAYAVEAVAYAVEAVCMGDLNASDECKRWHEDWRWHLIHHTIQTTTKETP